MPSYPEWFEQMASQRKGGGTRTAKELLNNKLSDDQRLAILGCFDTSEAFVKHITAIRILLKQVVAGDPEALIASFRQLLLGVGRPEAKGPRNTAKPRGEVHPTTRASTEE